jgi:hypothetical protein
MSELKVNKISPPRSGTDVTLGDSGDTFTVPSGATLDTTNATVTYPAGSITDAAISSTAAIQQSKISGSPGFRNIVINGDMSIAQRSTSVASITASGYYTLDRFNFNIVTMGTWTMSQDSDVPTGQGFAKSLKLDCTTADAAPSAGDRLRIMQAIEGQNLQYLKYATANAESLTLSFWVKSNKTGTYIASFYNDNAVRYISKSYTINLADTWEKKTITYAGDTVGSIGNTNTNILQLQMWLGAGSNFTSGTLATSWEAETASNAAVGQVNLADNTSNYINITGVQLEAGTTASDFEFLPVDVNLARCQRYYQEIESSNDWQAFASKNDNTTEVYATLSLPTSLRASPTLNNPNFNYFDSSSSQSSSGGTTTVRKVSNNNSFLTLIKSGFTSITGNRVSVITPTQDLTIDSEL